MRMELGRIGVEWNWGKDCEAGWKEATIRKYEDVFS